mgnify:CR=1 FL=1|jgi:hypothetical protein|tara:strand:- start:322 stop:927 length:606 start_codon:yes stop_codon:yes gene_type:complete
MIRRTLGDKKRFILVTALCAMAFPVTVHALNTSNDARVEFRQVLTLGNEVDMDFGTIFVAGTPGAGDTVNMGTNGLISYTGGFSGSGTGTAGKVDITAGTNSQTVNVFCDASATMTNGAGASINVTAIETVAEGSETSFGSGNACNGMGSVAASIVLNIGTLDTFVFGGRIDGATATSFTGGNFSTANAGGDDIRVDIIYQ